MKRRCIGIAIAAAGILGGAGCGAEEEESPGASIGIPPSVDPADEEVEIPYGRAVDRSFCVRKPCRVRLEAEVIEGDPVDLYVLDAARFKRLPEFPDAAAFAVTGFLKGLSAVSVRRTEHTLHLTSGLYHVVLRHAEAAPTGEEGEDIRVRLMLRAVK